MLLVREVARSDAASTATHDGGVTLITPRLAKTTTAYVSAVSAGGGQYPSHTILNGILTSIMQSTHTHRARGGPLNVLPHNDSGVPSAMPLICLRICQRMWRCIWWRRPWVAMRLLQLAILLWSRVSFPCFNVFFIKSLCLCVSDDESQTEVARVYSFDQRRVCVLILFRIVCEILLTFIMIICQNIDERRWSNVGYCCHSRFDCCSTRVCHNCIG